MSSVSGRVGSGEELGLVVDGERNGEVKDICMLIWMERRCPVVIRWDVISCSRYVWRLAGFRDSTVRMIDTHVGRGDMYLWHEKVDICTGYSKEDIRYV